MGSSFTDHRGTIIDLLGPVDAVTEIVTKAGLGQRQPRPRKTVQFTYIVSGRLLVATLLPAPRDTQAGLPLMLEHGPGDLIEEAAGIPHAWRALEDTVVLVFTRGPRSGDAYETDTERLAVPLLTP